MKHLWKWRIELVVFISYLVLGVLYFHKKSVDPRRRRTLLDPLSRDFQLHLAKGGSPGQVVLYDLLGRRETVRPTDVSNRKQKFLDFILSGINQYGDMELVASTSSHYMQCSFISCRKVFIFPLNEALKFEPSKPTLFENLCDLIHRYEKEPADIKGRAFDDLVKLASVYFGSGLAFNLTITNNYVVFRMGQKVLAFPLNVKYYLDKYDISGFDDGEIIFNILMANFVPYICVPTGSNDWTNIPLSIPLKYRSSVPRHSAYYYHEKWKRLKNFEYEPYVNSNVTSHFQKVIDNTMHSQKFNILLNDIYQLLQEYNKKETS